MFLNAFDSATVNLGIRVIEFFLYFAFSVKDLIKKDDTLVEQHEDLLLELINADDGSLITAIANLGQRVQLKVTYGRTGMVLAHSINTTTI